MENRKRLQYIATQVYPELNPALKHLPYGQSKYGSLKRDYPQHWSSFDNMHTRAQRKGLEVAPDFRRNYQGFRNFIAYMSDPPPKMVAPTVGRIDHARGYVRGNMAWQARSANSREAIDRRYTPQRNERLKVLVETSFDLALFGVMTVTSTTLAALWKAIGEPCRSHDVPKVLATMADTFTGHFTWEVAKPGRGRRATLFRVWVSPELRQQCAA